MVAYIASYKQTHPKEPKLLRGARLLIDGVRNKKLTTKYSHDNIVDVNLGSYAVDCSGFVNTILISQQLHKALQEIQSFIEKVENVPRPTAPLQPWPLHYVLFLQSEVSKKCWKPVMDARLLEPGDIVAYTRNNHENSSSEDGQHVMIVADKIKHSSAASWVFVPIFDSTKKLHGPNDVRGKKDKFGSNLGGIGCAEIMLEINSVGKPDRIKWYPESQYPKCRNITMARIIEKNC